MIKITMDYGTTQPTIEKDPTEISFVKSRDKFGSVVRLINNRPENGVILDIMYTILDLKSVKIELNNKVILEESNIQSVQYTYEFNNYLQRLVEQIDIKLVK